MDRADRWQNHAFSSLHASSTLTEISTSSISDLDLSIHVRSLSIALDSRCGLDALLTPPSTLDLKSKENAQRPTKASRASCQHISNLSIAKLAPINVSKQAMGVMKFDGPAGQIQDNSAEGFHRHSQQPVVDNSDHLGTSDSESVSSAGINHRSSGYRIGAERRMPITPFSKRTSQDKLRNTPLTTRKPRFTVRTVTPKRSTTIGEISPVAKHVPGSFRSEISVTTAEDSKHATPTISSRGTELQRHDSELQSFSVHPQETAQSSSAQASGKLVQAAPKHTVKPLRSMTTQAGLEKDKRGSDAVAASQLADRPKRNPFFKPYSSHSQIPRSANPSLEVNPISSTRTETTETKRPTDDGLAMTRTSPVHKTKSPKNRGLLGDSVEHPEQLLEYDIKGQSSRLGNDIEPQPKRIEMGTQPGQRLFPLKASQRSGLESLADLNNSSSLPSSLWSKHDMIDFINEATRLRRSISMSSSSNTGSTGESSDMTRLIQSVPAGKHSRWFANTVASSSEAHTPPPRHHWVHHLLGQRNSPPLREAHLTRRLSTIENGLLENRDGASHYHQTDVHDPLNGNIGKETTNAIFATQHRQQLDPATISRAILDLESLMREVLQIAKHVAAEKEVEHTGSAFAVQDPTDPVNSMKYSRETGYDRHTLPLGHAMSNEGVWATADGNISVSDERHDFVESAIAAQERSSAQKSRLQAGSANITPSLNQEFPSVSAHAREVAHHLGLADPLLQAPDNDQRQRDARRESVLIDKSLATSRGGLTSPSVVDFAAKARRGSVFPEVIELPELPRKPLPSQKAAKEQRSVALRDYPSPFDESLQAGIASSNAPQAPQRANLVVLQEPPPQDGDHFHTIELGRESSSSSSGLSFAGESLFRRHMTGFSGGAPLQQPGPIGPGKLPAQDTITTLRSPTKTNKSQDDDNSLPLVRQPRPNLRKVHHFSIRGAPEGFSLRHAHRRAPIARDWSATRKRFVATVTCINTALLGIIIGIYAGEVPAIQYAIADENHYTILGNVVFYLGLAIPTILFWPLPLLHGRKPYTLAALTILMPLQFPQALVVGSFRSPDSPEFRVGLLLSRSFAGVAMGFANFNFMTTLLDLFGASLQSSNPHQEVVNENDVRRHGGGMGVWLGIWTWCSIGSLGFGFFIGAVIISGLDVAWGFWITIILTAAVLLLNVVTPEVRRSAYRRSLAEVPQDGGNVSRRIARGEIMMHLYQTGPLHWWEEVRAGLVLVGRMLSQPAFVVMAVYLGWIYGQIVMIIVVSLNPCFSCPAIQISMALGFLNRFTWY